MNAEQQAPDKQIFGPQSLAVAIAKTVHDYVAAVQAGKITYPAHRREEASVVEIWADLRIEALHKLFNFGRSAPFLLSERRHQEELLTCFLDDKAHLEIPQPRGAEIPDTIQAMFQVYQYLDAAGSEVGDRETDRTSLKLKSRSILDRIEAECVEQRSKLAAFRAGAGDGTIPATMIELLYTDVTAKAKSIALSARFGPDYENGIKSLEDYVVKQGIDVSAFQSSIARVMAAKDPDYLSNEQPY